MSNEHPSPSGTELSALEFRCCTSSNISRHYNSAINTLKPIDRRVAHAGLGNAAHFLAKLSFGALVAPHTKKAHSRPAVGRAIELLNSNQFQGYSLRHQRGGQAISIGLVGAGGSGATPMSSGSLGVVKSADSRILHLATAAKSPQPPSRDLREGFSQTEV
jgi:hypothetical protein